MLIRTIEVPVHVRVTPENPLALPCEGVDRPGGVARDAHLGCCESASIARSVRGPLSAPREHFLVVVAERAQQRVGHLLDPCRQYPGFHCESHAPTDFNIL